MILAVYLLGIGCGLMIGIAAWALIGLAYARKPQ